MRAAIDRHLPVDLNVMHTEPPPGTVGMFMFMVDRGAGCSTQGTTACDGLHEHPGTQTHHSPAYHDGTVTDPDMYSDTHETEEGGKTNWEMHLLCTWLSRGSRIPNY